MHKPILKQQVSIVDNNICIDMMTLSEVFDYFSMLLNEHGDCKINYTYDSRYSIELIRYESQEDAEYRFKEDMVKYQQWLNSEESLIDKQINELKARLHEIKILKEGVNG